MKVYFIGPNLYGSISMQRSISLEKIYNNDFTHIANNLNPGLLNLQIFKLLFYKIGFKSEFIEKINRKILKNINPDHDFGLVIVDKGQVIKSETLAKLRKKCPKYYLLLINVDNPFVFSSWGWCLFLKSLPYYNLILAPRQSCVKYYKEKFNVRSSFFYYPISTEYHKSDKIHVRKKIITNPKYIFIGTFEVSRFIHLFFASVLIKNNISIYGPRWKYLKYIPFLNIGDGESFGKYYKILTLSADIVFCFLNIRNKDTQNTRFWSVLALKKIIIVKRNNISEKFLGKNYPLLYSTFYDFLKLIYKLKTNQVDFMLAQRAIINANKYIVTSDDFWKNITNEICRYNFTNTKRS